MTPCFFGDARRQLFGVHHPASDAPGAGTSVAGTLAAGTLAAGTPARRTGVVLCYPGPQEYRQAHWAYRRLAALLAERGLPVLRFDYHATGDSAGDAAEGRLAQWVDDVATAAQELRDVAGVRRIALVGMRLGAAIAARAAAAAGASVTDLVLWDPVVCGADYLAGLDAEHAAGLRNRAYPEDDQGDADEVLGFILPPTMRAAVAEVDLVAEGCGRPNRVLVIAGDDGPEYAALEATLGARGLACALHHVADPTLARGGHWSSDTLVARHAPGVIADFLGRR